MKEKGKRWFQNGIEISGILGVAAIGLFFCLPIGILFTGSFADNQELNMRLLPILQDSDAYVKWKWIPDYPTLEHFKQILFYTPSFLTLFWNSVGMVGLILMGQLFIGVPAAWAFAVYEFKGKRQLFELYVVLMLMPFQVTMFSRYLVLERLGLLDTKWAVVLPAVFSTFPVFLVYRSFSGLSGTLLEAARMDGAGEWVIFKTVGLPLAKGGIASAVILGFLEYWNMMEEPLAYLKSQRRWPLSLYLPEISLTQAGYAFAASFITITVSLFVFAIFQDSLEQGIAAGVVKG